MNITHTYRCSNTCFYVELGQNLWLMLRGLVCSNTIKGYKTCISCILASTTSTQTGSAKTRGMSGYVTAHVTFDAIPSVTMGRCKSKTVNEF